MKHSIRLILKIPTSEHCFCRITGVLVLAKIECSETEGIFRWILIGFQYKAHNVRGVKRIGGVKHEWKCHVECFHKIKVLVAILKSQLEWTSWVAGIIGNSCKFVPNLVEQSGYVQGVGSEWNMETFNSSEKKNSMESLKWKNHNIPRTLFKHRKNWKEVAGRMSLPKFMDSK